MKKLIAATIATLLTTGILSGCAGAASGSTAPSSTAASSAASESASVSEAAAEETQIDKALALINTFTTGDTETARSLLAEDYIQHNLAYGTGADAFVGSVEYLASAEVKTTVQNIRAFEDGDKVFLQTIYNFAGAGDQVAFDIFRFDENGKIAEHWDNLATVTEANPSGHTQTDGTMEVTDLDKTEENRELVNNFLYDVMQGHNLDKMADYFDGDNYIQHNSNIADGVSGLTDALAALAEQNIQMVYPSGAGRWQLCAGCQRGHLWRCSHRLLRPVACGERQDRRALGCDGDHRRPVHLAESERQVLMVTGR